MRQILQRGKPFTESDFTVNEKYGWCEYEKDGVKYVVLAGATHEGLQDPTLIGLGYKRIDYIHYFSYNDVVSFKFKNMNDDTVYPGIILDSCGVSHDPQGEDVHGGQRWQKGDGVQVLDVYFPASKYNEAISDQEIEVSMDGSFSSSAGTKSSASTKKTLIELATKLLLALGDGIQVVMNYAGTDMSWDDCKKITYSKNDIEEDDELKEYIQVEESSSSTDTKNSSDEKVKKGELKTVDILSSVNNEKGEDETIYTSSTEIPVMPIDFYSSSIDIFDIFDIDFLSNSNENEDKFWNILKDATRGISHIVMYISAGVIISLIIWRTILLVKSSLRDEPEEAYSSKKIMDDLVKSVLMISFSYFIMIILMYVYEEILKIVIGDSKSIYLIKANVEGVYSFNTNIIGYIRYLSLTTNVTGAFGYSILYFLMQLFVNLLWFGLMFFRTIIIAGLIIIAPLAGAYNMVNRTKKSGNHFTNILEFKTLMKVYIRTLFIPLAGIILYKLILFLA